MKEFIKKIGRAILCVMISAVIGMLLLDLVYLIPTEKTELNASTAVPVFVSERPLYVNSINYPVQSVTDPYSDSVILSECFIRRSGEPFYVSALRGTYLEEGGATDLSLPYLGFINYFTYGNDNWTVIDYSRYWNGYQVPLIPLLQFFTYPQLRIGSTLLFLILTFGAMVSVYKKYSWKYLLTFVCSILAIFPFYFYKTFQTVRVYNITMFATILFCLLKKEKREMLFLFLGITIAYFDLFSYPFYAPGMLTVLTIIDMKDEKNNIEVIKKVLTYLMFFCIGHLGMWAMKWVLTYLIADHDIFKVAWKRYKIHMGGTITYKMGLENIILLVSTVWEDYTLIMFSLVAVGALMVGLKLGFDKRMWKDALLFALAALIPFVWCTVVIGHSYWHPFFNFRDFGISVFAVFSWLVGIPKAKEAVEKQLEQNI